MFGSPDCKVDWLHIDNMVAALQLAARGLSHAGGGVVGGQVGEELCQLGAGAVVQLQQMPLLPILNTARSLGMGHSSMSCDNSNRMPQKLDF